MAIEQTPVVVTNPTELANAVADDDVDTIVLGADIQIPTVGIVIPASKESLTFIGTNEGTRYTLTDVNSDLPTQTLRVNAASDITLTFQNMDMVGRNFYGIPYILEIGTTGVTVNYIDVTYNGVQIAYNPMGLTRFVDCTINITEEEVGEVNRVEFEGVNHITHTNSSDAVFWFRGAAGTAYMKVLPGASVTIESTNYFMYNLIPVLLPSTQNPVVFEVLENAALNITTRRGFSLDTAHRVASFLVDEEAEFRYEQLEPNGTQASMYVNGSFIVNDGATVHMEAYFDGAYPLINFITGTSPQLQVNDPKRFVLYDRSSAPIALTSPATRNFMFSGSQINYWTIPGDYPSAGTLLDEPQKKWNRPNWNDFNISGNISQNTTNVTGTSLTPEEQLDLPDIEDLVFQTARVISVGELPIISDIVADDGRVISGQSEPGAAIEIKFTVAGYEHIFTTTAIPSGGYFVNPQMVIPADTIITIKANTPFLITEIEVTVVSVSDEIVIQRAPVTIEFKLPPIITSPLLLGRTDPSDHVEVLDNRTVGSQWNLSAALEGPLEAETGDILENAVVFRQNNGDLLELGTTPTVVHTGDYMYGQTNIAWPATEGILVRLNGPVRAGVHYTTTIKWGVEPI